MDIKDLTCFMKICEEKSINKAAHQLYITPQGLSKVVRNLEAELETELLRRTSKGVEPTESGMFFYRKCKQLISEFIELKAGIKQITSCNHTLKLGYACGISNAIPLETMNNFREDYPDLTICMEECLNDEIREKVIGSEIDVGFVVGRTGHPGVIEKKIMTKPFTVLIYEGHRLYEKDTVSIADLENEPLITLNEKFNSYHTLHQVCHDYGFIPNIVVKTMESRMIQKLCKKKVGLGIDVKFESSDYNLDGIRVAAVRDAISWDIYMIYKKENQNYPNIQTFNQYMSQVI